MKESLKPIEPGCLVLVNYSPSIVHMQVRRVSRRALAFRAERCSACGRAKTRDAWHLEGVPDFRYCACILVRIDPDDEIREDEAELDAATELERTLRKAGVWQA